MVKRRRRPARTRSRSEVLVDVAFADAVIAVLLEHGIRASRSGEVAGGLVVLLLSREVAHGGAAATDADGAGDGADPDDPEASDDSSIPEGADLVAHALDSLPPDLAEHVGTLDGFAESEPVMRSSPGPSYAEAPPESAGPGPEPSYAEPPAESPAADQPAEPAEPPAADLGPAANPSPPPSPAPAPPPERYTAYPRLEAPGVVVPDEPFDLLIALGDRRDWSNTASGSLDLPTPSEAHPTRVDVRLAYDPLSFAVGPGIDAGTLALVATPGDPFPSLAVRLRMLPSNDRPMPHRRIGVHFLVDGVLRGVAYRSFTEGRRVAGALGGEDGIVLPPDTGETPAPRPIDLRPLLDAEPPDLVLAIYRSDSDDDDEYAFAAFPASAAAPVPAVALSSLGGDGGDGADLAESIRLTIAQYSGARAAHLRLVGFGKRIGAAIPRSVLDLIRSIAEQPGRTEAATVLLITEESRVPWELAAAPGLFDAGSPFGGASPFLGAHVAIGRWPLLDDQAAPVARRSSIAVRSSAVLTADYAGVPGWNPLPEATAEAAALATRLQPTTSVRPYLDEMLACFAADVDVLHFALHGQFAEVLVDGGLVVLRTDASGAVVSDFFTEIDVSGLTLGGAPFVFLNACQVGQSRTMLGDYAGMAAAFLGVGATAVVAALWNVDDVWARKLALEFYELALDGVAAGEILRRFRARYLVDATTVEADAPHPTLLAYQLTGHPLLRLAHG